MGEWVDTYPVVEMTRNNPSTEHINERYGSNRRKFIGGITTVGLTSLIGSVQAKQDSGFSQQEDRGSPWAPKKHDHSGEHNTATRLGEASPVESIIAKQSYTTQYPQINVDAFGATGDGETDDTTAVQTAVNSPETGKSGILSFSGGKEYYIPGTITVDASKIRGIEGNNASLITDNNNAVLHYQGTFQGTASPDSGNVPEIATKELGPYIRNIQIYNNGPYSYTNSPYQGTGIKIERTFNLNIEGCHIFRMNTGIRIEGRNRNINILGNRIYDNRPYGIHFSDANLHQVNCIGNFITYAVDPIYMEDSDVYNMQLSGNDIEVSSTGSKSCIRAEGGTVQEWTIDGNTIQGHGAVPRILDFDPNNAQYISITGNHISNSSATGIYMNAGNSDFEGVIITGNTAKNFNEHFVSIVGQDFPHFIMSGNSIDNGLCFKGDIATYAGPMQVSDNTVSPTGYNEAVIAVSGQDGLRSVKVVDNTVYPGSTNQDENEWMISLTTPGDVISVLVNENQVFARGGERSGIQISSGSNNYRGIIAKNNIAREIGSAATAFDFPNEEPDNNVVNNNLNI